MGSSPNEGAWAFHPRHSRFATEVKDDEDRKDDEVNSDSCKSHERLEGAFVGLAASTQRDTAEVRRMS